LYLWKVSGSNRGLSTGYLDRVFVIFFNFFRHMLVIVHGNFHFLLTVSSFTVIPFDVA